MYKNLIIVFIMELQTPVEQPNYELAKMEEISRILTDFYFENMTTDFPEQKSEWLILSVCKYTSTSANENVAA